MLTQCKSCTLYSKWSSVLYYGICNEVPAYSNQSSLDSLRSSLGLAATLASNNPLFGFAVCYNIFSSHLLYFQEQQMQIFK